MLISQSNLRSGAQLFPHPGFINQGNKKAVIPAHTGVYTWSQLERHVKGERNTAWRHQFFQSLYLGNEMETGGSLNKIQAFIGQILTSKPAKSFTLYLNDGQPQ